MMKHQPTFKESLDRQRPMPHKMAGLSLVELMIAMLLGVILTLGATQVYLGTSQSYRLTDAVAYGQENIRFASSIMQRDIRGAGGVGCLRGADALTDNLQGTRVVPIGDGMLAWEATGTGIGDQYTATTALGSGSSGWAEGSGVGVFPAEITGDVVAGTDVLIVNSIQTSAAEVTGFDTGKIDLGGPSGIPEGQIVLAVDRKCEAGELFQNTNDDSASSVAIGSGLTPGNLFTALGGDYDPEPDVTRPASRAQISSYNTVAYYIGIGASGEPSLFRRRLDTINWPDDPQELIEGVESMQFLYGVSAGGGKNADRYDSADNVTNWEDVVSIRAAFIVRSDDGANSEDLTRKFNLLGTEVTTSTDRRARLVATSTIGLRNRLE